MLKFLLALPSLPAAPCAAALPLAKPSCSTWEARASYGRGVCTVMLLLPLPAAPCTAVLPFQHGPAAQPGHSSFQYWRSACSTCWIVFITSIKIDRTTRDRCTAAPFSQLAPCADDTETGTLEQM
eukprot:1162036-Pelagomonas_calceolata.AAC.14